MASATTWWRTDLTTRWHRRQPIWAGLAVGVVGYVLTGLTLRYLGDADASEAWGLPTILGAITVWYVSWAVFSRDRAEPRVRGRRPDRHRPDEDEPR